MFTLRFDMRAPATGAPAADLYQAALEISAWAETHGGLSALLCEHHSSPDGYLPAPIPLASAIAARTKNLPIAIAIFMLPLYDPVRLAEEMIEYEMYGVDFHRRGAIAEEKLALLLKAVTGEAFEHQGRRIRVTPPPFTAGGPKINWGGGSLAAARRAGRYGLGFFAQKGNPELRVAYEEASRANGHTPGMCILPPREAANVVFVADDLDAAWAELGPYLMHDVLSYAAWNEGDTETSSLSCVKTAEALREENRSHRIVTVDQAVALIRAGAPLPLHPLIGGLPPKIAWRYLETVANKVIPAVART